VAALFVCLVCASGGNQLDYEYQELTWSMAAAARILLRFLPRNVAFSEREVGNLWGKPNIGSHAPVLGSLFSVLGYRVFS
jgi:hypothetical protein